ncbi:MAG: hypothetical protein ABW352_16125 [Polyangiales bacterium]
MPLKSLTFLACCLGLLGACTSKRPEGAYTPEYKDPTACLEGFECEDPDAGEDVQPGDQEPDDQVPDPSEPDATVPAEDLDAGPPPMVDPTQPLSGLVGRYLMRVDYYSTADETDTASNARLILKNRVSNLFLTELTLSDGVLRSNEKLCFQSSAHTCVEGCEGWKTTYASQLPSVIAQRARPLQRTFAVDEANNLVVTSEDGLLPLGYDDTVPNHDNMPTAYSDLRVWKLGTAEDRLRGVATVLTGTLRASVIASLPLNCEVDSVQLFATAFKGKLAAPTSAELAKRIMEVDSTGSGAVPIQAVGTPSQFCTLSKLKESNGASRETGFVRFKPTTSAACPASASAFESAFKIAENVDPPTPTDRK